MKKKKLLLVAFLFGVVGAVQAATVSEYITVISMYLKNPSEMGEVAPVSQIVGIELSKYVAKNSKDISGPGKKYLEAGGGAGAISICIAENLRSQDHLDVIEINPDLCKVLKKRLKKYSNVSVHCCSILDWHPGYQYDAVISTLPFLSLGVDFAKQAISYFQRVSGKDCMFSCVEYPIVTKFRALIHNLGLKNVSKVDVQRYMESVRKKYLKNSETIYYNIPPINVYHMSFGL